MLTFLYILTVIVSIFSIFTIVYVLREVNLKHKKILAIEHNFQIGETVYYKNAPFEVVKVDKYTLTIKHGFESVVCKDSVTWK